MGCEGKQTRARRVRLIKSAKTGLHTCPWCRAAVEWFCRGTKGWARCANNISSTRIYVAGQKIYICEWEGHVRRRRDGVVELFYIEYYVDTSDV
mgnify:CR=1 FL=1